MNKKNSGFSLVELIVVIAIMAVLVGVLAPAYLKYVEKSRKSTDIDALSEMIEAAKNIAADSEYEALTEEDAQFVVTVNGANNSGKAVMTAVAKRSTDSSADNSELASAWIELANVKNSGVYSLKSKEFKKSTAGTDNKTTQVVFTGTVKADGSVTWSSNKPSNAFFKYSSSFEDKFVS